MSTTQQEHTRDPALTPVPTTLPRAGGREVLGAVGRRLRPQLPRTLGSLVVLLASAGCGLVMPLVLGIVVDAVTGNVTHHPLIGDGDPWRVLAVLLIALAVGSALNGLGTAWLAGAADRVVASLREDNVAAALTLDQERAEAVGSGEVVSRSSDDFAAVTSAVNIALPSAIAAVTGIVVTVAGMAGMAGIHWAFALVLVVVTVPVYAVAVRRYLRQAPPLYRAERAQRAVRAGMVLGTGAVTLGAATTAVLFFLRLYNPIGTALMMLDQLQSAYTSLGRIVGLVRIGSDHSGARSAVPTASDAAAARTGSAGSAAAGSRAAAPVVVRDLDVHYGERRAVADVNFEVAPGASVALVGASGAGKSTVAAVVAGVRTPSRGAVRIAGQDPHALPPAERARVVALVSQEIHVFSGTLRENLTLAASNSGDRAVWDALRAVGLAEWVEELHEGLDTPVFDGSPVLGDMRCQQLALARVALLGPSVVVLDEPVSRAARGEAEILARAVAEVSRERTAITVVHHLDQAALCDRILVMADGAVIEEGTHEGLLARGGRYAQLWEASHAHEDGANEGGTAQR
ncbi:ABC transporter ATP-binding protein [Kocuria sp. cx-116]|uniref:ABC transporter ATP-binding protein n=1 Tax=Kocuria sp. cx-116 TaxID=2771378 RepID=UPI0016856480|nr:ABC transporter ATP-binding protein [Kocuria sp. cx-116]MBD2761222.1 ABC transporter ATP-binding protein [Kocuria sp. cx-116]